MAYQHQSIESKHDSIYASICLPMRTRIHLQICSAREGLCTYGVPIGILYVCERVYLRAHTRCTRTHRLARRAGRTAAPHGAEYSSTPTQYPPQECACAAAAVPPVHARARAYKPASFASEPIQPPIVPVKPFEPRELRSAARARERTDLAERRRAGPSPPRGIAGGAGAQHDEVGERAERGRKRAAQLVPRGIAAQRRRLPPHRLGVCTRACGWYVLTHAICRCTDQRT